MRRLRGGSARRRARPAERRAASLVRDGCIHRRKAQPCLSSFHGRARACAAVSSPVLITRDALGLIAAPSTRTHCASATSWRRHCTNVPLCVRAAPRLARELVHSSGASRLHARGIALLLGHCILLIDERRRQSPPRLDLDKPDVSWRLPPALVNNLMSRGDCLLRSSILLVGGSSSQAASLWTLL